MKLPNWFAELVESIRAEIERQDEGACENRPFLVNELESIRRKISGWKQSLAEPDLSLEIRRELEAEWTAAASRDRELKQSLSAIEDREGLSSGIVDESTVSERFVRLAEILAQNNPTRGNLELSLHIDKITCDVDGRVELRTCKLGAMPEVVDALLRLSTDEGSDLQPAEPPDRSRNGRRNGLRRRSKLRVIDVDDVNDDANGVAEFAADSHRFGKLDDQFFWVDTFQVPARSSWVRENSKVVLDRFEQLQKDTGTEPSLNQLAREFGKSRPTVKTALDIARGIYKAENREKTPRRFTPPLDSESRENIVNLYWTDELSRKEIAERLGLHRNTVTKILNEEYGKSGQKRPDGRRQRWIRPRNARVAD